MKKKGITTNKQTLQCDFLECSSKISSVDVISDTVKASKLEARNIVSPILDQLLSEIEEIKKRIMDIERNLSVQNLDMLAPYKNTEIVETELHFEKIKLDDPLFDTNDFVEKLKTKLVIQAFFDGIAQDFHDLSEEEKTKHLSRIKIPSLKPTGSATVKIEIEYDKDKGDEQENLKSFLQNSNELSDSFTEFGGVETLKVEVGKEMRSIVTKISDIEDRLDAEEVSFARSQSILLSDFKLQVDTVQGTLKLLQYDETNGSYVGGSLQLDI